MDVGLLFDLRNPQQWHRPWADHYAQTLEFCEEADRLGAGGLWFTEHHLFEDGYLPQPLAFAAAAAARTRRARIGTSVVLPALHHPVDLAEQAALVDLISGGRLELGLGAGYRVPEYELFGADFTRRFAGTERNIREILRLWADRSVSPLPLQNPPPVWGGFYGPRGAKFAGRLGIGLLHISRPMFKHYRQGLVEAGHDPRAARVSDLVPLILSEDPEKAWHRVAPHLAHQVNSYRQGSVEGKGRTVPLLTAEDLRDPNAQDPRGLLDIVTPEDAAVRIKELTKDLPVEHLIFWASIAGMPDDIAAENLRLVTGKLPPLLR
ncbi:LLM class flavin-dependent oxidoreductase [Actinacidiphila acididurans]|uniref:LLM class flavin-dependent oxidoreductase n=1 Tax=Actinacidiphila acididurans TaxID=2784346 RepID=A0ABS2TJC6_9ACTN|nr:LLM class flavin-dependent oxidoreductase [Actinacidiphila acididurans]MBM9503458.1 LLM class flavin-dependent oxidoreductase [Actinacidiphila acididurans]